MQINTDMSSYPRRARFVLQISKRSSYLVRHKDGFGKTGNMNVRRRRGESTIHKELVEDNNGNMYGTIQSTLN